MGERESTRTVPHQGPRASGRPLRRLAPALVAAVAGASLSCQGDCPPNTTVTGGAPVPTFAIRPRYVLANLGGQAPPVVLVESGTTRVRLVTDTLLFADVAPTAGGTQPTSGTYTEILVLGTRQPDGSEALSRTVAPALVWTRSTSGGAITLQDFSGGATRAIANAGVLEPTGATPGLTVFGTAGRTYAFEAR